MPGGLRVAQTQRLKSKIDRTFSPEPIPRALTPGRLTGP